MCGYIEVQDSAASMCDDNEHIEALKVTVGTVKKSTAAIASW
jgi:hypothetical protein